jgi:hypothetical protein
MWPWKKSKTPWAASAAATSQRLTLNPTMATQKKTIMISDSTSIAWTDPPITANRT